MAGKLTPRQERFCAEYLKDLNGTRAAKDAGYSKSSASQLGSETLAIPKVQAEIARLQAERAKRTEIDSDTVLREILKLATSDLRGLFDENGKLLPIDQWPDGIAPAVSSIEVDELFEGYGKERVQIGETKKVRLWDKPKALELLGKHLKLFTEKHEHSGPNGKPIETRDLTGVTDAELDAQIAAALTKVRKEPEE